MMSSDEMQKKLDEVYKKIEKRRGSFFKQADIAPTISKEEAERKAEEVQRKRVYSSAPLSLGAG